MKGGVNMARPQTKDELLTSAETSLEELISLINGLSDTKRHQLFQFQLRQTDTQAHWQRDKNMRDVMIHLYEWHQLVIVWVESNVSGTPRSFFPPPYNWRNYAQLNEDFLKQHKRTTYDQALALLLTSHTEILQLISSFSDEELFTKQHFNWTGTTTLGSYFTSSTTSHYVWAIKKIKRHIKE